MDLLISPHVPLKNNVHIFSIFLQEQKFYSPFEHSIMYNVINYSHLHEEDNLRRREVDIDPVRDDNGIDGAGR